MKLYAMICTYQSDLCGVVGDLWNKCSWSSARFIIFYFVVHSSRFLSYSALSCHLHWQMSAACTRFTATTDLAQKRGRTWWCSLYKRFHAWMHMQPEKSTLTKSLLSFTKSCQSNHALEAAFSAVQMLVEMVSLIAIAAEATVPSCAMM